MQRRITFAEIARRPGPGGNAPGSVRFSPDSRWVTYLYSSAGTLNLELWGYHRETGREMRLLEPAGELDERRLSREEQLRRERQRQLATGVTGYAWSEEGDTLLVQAGGKVLVRRGTAGEWREVCAGIPVIDPQLNRDGSRLAFVSEAEVHVLDLTDPGASPVRLTHDASPADAYGDRAITNGLAEFVAQEEMGRSSGFWWSPDGTWIAFQQTDHTPVPLFLIAHPGTDAPEVEAHRYPFAGQSNVAVRLGVMPATGGSVRWLPLPSEETYLARVHWTPDGHILVQLQSRDQTRLDVRRMDPATGAWRTLWTDEVRPWVNLTDDLRFIRLPDAAPEDYSILWSSERSGRRELYRYTRDGELAGQISAGDVRIDCVRSVDAAGGWVYVEGWDETPLERHLFRIPLAGGPAERITRTAGTHTTVIAGDHSAFVDLHSSVDAPPSATLCQFDGTPVARLQAGAAPDPRIAELDLRPPEFFTLRADDGTVLHAALYRPREVSGGRKAPVVVSVYGGPTAQVVSNCWGMTADLRAQYLAQEGFFVLKTDNRGSARRGLFFEGAIHRNLGDLEVRDQVAGVRALAAMVPEADVGRVGVYGWSYGGYMALMCLARAPDVFRASVAGAPVTHWDGYDTHYTERYLGTPDNNPEGYRTSAVMTHAAAIRGRLLLIHGMVDENVHFRHTARLIQVLNREEIPYEVLLLPEERHGPRDERARAAVERQVAGFLKASLG